MHTMRMRVAIFINLFVATYMLVGFNTASAAITQLPGKKHNCSVPGSAGFNDYDVKLTYDKDTTKYKVKPHYLEYKGHSLSIGITAVRVTWYKADGTGLGTRKVTFDTQAKSKKVDLGVTNYKWTSYGTDIRPYSKVKLYKNEGKKVHCEIDVAFRPDVGLPK